MKTQPGKQRIAGRNMARRTQRPGDDAGLANENRPGLGTRADEERDPGAVASETPAAEAPTRPLPTPPPERPPQREQDSTSWEQELQRSTSMSGQSAGV